MPRPSPHKLKALRAEIASRYATKRKRKPFMVSLRMRDLRRLQRARYPHGISNDAPGRDLVTVIAHHIAALPRNPRTMIMAFIAEDAPWFTIAEQQQLIHDVLEHPQRWRADALAWRLRLIDADRAELHITTIGSIDVSKEQRARRRRKRKIENARKWRANRKRTIEVPNTP